MNSAVSVHPLCTLSIQTLAAPDVDVKLKLPDSILINHLNQDIYIHTHKKYIYIFM